MTTGVIYRQPVTSTSILEVPRPGREKRSYPGLPLPKGYAAVAGTTLPRPSR
jgi:hypothetical protein